MTAVRFGVNANLWNVNTTIKPDERGSVAQLAPKQKRSWNRAGLLSMAYLLLAVIGIAGTLALTSMWLPGHWKACSSVVSTLVRAALFFFFS